MNKMVFVLLAAAVLSIASCGPKKSRNKGISKPIACADGTAMDVGIIGGKTLSKDAWLAKGMVALITKGVDRFGDDSYSLCTGTLITRDVILTAAHCVDDRKDLLASSVTVIFGIEPRCDLAKTDRSQVLRIADKVIVHEGYGDGIGEKDDLALIRMSSEAPSDYHTVSMATEFTKLDADQKIYVSGYGSEVEYNDKSSDLTRLKYAEVRPFVNDPSATSQLFPSTYNNDSATMLYDQRKGQGACAGDSGGPSLIRTEEGIKVLGVASRVERLDFHPRQQEDVTCKQGAVYTSVYFYRDWIDKNTQSLRAN